MNALELAEILQKWRTQDDLGIMNQASTMLRTIPALETEIEALKDTLHNVIINSAKETERLKTIPMKYKRMEFNARLQAEIEILKGQLKWEQEEVERVSAIQMKYAEEIEALKVELDKWKNDCRMEGISNE